MLKCEVVDLDSESKEDLFFEVPNYHPVVADPVCDLGFVDLLKEYGFLLF